MSSGPGSTGPGAPAMGIRAAARTDVGRSRERNEDSYYAGTTVFAVADGLGGHRGGDVASQTAIGPLRDLDGKPERAAQGLASAVRRGNQAIVDRAQGEAALRGMGTTMTAVALHHGRAHLAHVGDSRFYLIRGDAITQVSEDHTVVARMVKEGRLTAAEAERHPQRSLLMRALGSEESVQVDEAVVPVSRGDRLLLCSDGLTAVVSPEEILEIAAGNEDLDSACEQLIERANRGGGPDNITVVLVEITADPPGGSPRTPLPSPPPRPVGSTRERRSRIPLRPIVWILILATLGAGGWGGFRALANRSFFVATDAGQVVVYRGLSGDLFRSFASVEEETGLRLADVRVDWRQRVEDGLRASSIEEAREIVENLPRVRPLPPDGEEEAREPDGGQGEPDPASPAGRGP